MSVCLSVCLFVCLSVCLFVFVCLFVCLLLLLLVVLFVGCCLFVASHLLCGLERSHRGTCLSLQRPVRRISQHTKTQENKHHHHHQQQQKGISMHLFEFQRFLYAKLFQRHPVWQSGIENQTGQQQKQQQQQQQQQQHKATYDPPPLVITGINVAKPGSTPAFKEAKEEEGDQPAAQKKNQHQQTNSSADKRGNATHRE